jgi:hypothetical protein
MEQRTGATRAPGGDGQKTISFSFGTVAGLLLGAIGLYAGLFSGVLVVTAAVADALAATLLCWILLPHVSGLRRMWKPPIPDRLATAAVTAAAVGLAGSLTYVAARPPDVPPTLSAEICLYDVAASGGVPIPLVADGTIKGSFSLTDAQLNAISLVIGLDQRTADKETPHPVRLHLTGGGFDGELPAQDIVDNGLTRFNLPKPLEIKRTEQFTMTIINASSEQVGVYVKVLDKIDAAVGLGDGLVIKGHAGQEATYQDPDHALSGCAAGRRT